MRVDWKIYSILDGGCIFFPVFAVRANVGEIDSVAGEYIADSAQIARSVVGDGGNVWLGCYVLLKWVSLKYLPELEAVEKLSSLFAKDSITYDFVYIIILLIKG